MKETTLISRLQSQEDKAFQELVELYQQQVYNTCLGMIQSEEEAEDLAQEVFVEAFRAINNFRADAQLGTWLYRISVNKSLELIRKKKRKKRWAFFQAERGEAVETEAASRFVHPGVELENKERAQVLFWAIEKLSDKQRVAFTLNKVDGLSYQEVAETMEMSLASVEGLIFRARKSLQKLLYHYYQQSL
ncbi:MAG: sigma-70 family RNA polymerase sigma factor [Bacteroidota bacterium]